MASSDEQLAPTALIVGCGYLGRRLAMRLRAQGVQVFGTTRSERSQEALANLGVRPLLVEVTQSLTLTAVRPALEAEQLDVFYLVPPGRRGRDPSPEEVVLDGSAHVLKALRRTNVRRAIAVSSTAVYGQRQGERVDANTPPEPTDERGKLLLQGERQWLAAGPAMRVVRLAGMYGPQRIIGHKGVLEGSPIVGDANAVLNLIHVDDAVELLLKVATTFTAGDVELGCDDRPVTRLEYYRHLAQCLNVATPRVLNDVQAAQMLGLNQERLGRVTSKTCDNTLTRERTGWAPRYPDYQAGLAEILGPPETE